MRPRVTAVSCAIPPGTLRLKLRSNCHQYGLCARLLCHSANRYSLIVPRGIGAKPPPLNLSVGRDSRLGRTWTNYSLSSTTPRDSPG